MGRFLTPDWAGKPAAVPYAHFGNPQSLNLYSYVENNPLSVTDPDGHAPIMAISATAPPQCDLNACSTEVMLYGERGTAGNGIAPPTIPDPVPAQDPPQAQQDQENNATGYSTANAAAKAALGYVNPRCINENREYAGYIYHDAHGRYHYTGPANGTALASCPCGAKAPRKSTIVGDYHTHGNYSIVGPKGRIMGTGNPHRDDFNSDHFSGPDRSGVAVMERTRPGYLGYLGTPSGKFLIYDPVADKERELK